MDTKRVFNARESYISNMKIEILFRLFDEVGFEYKENEYSEKERRAKAMKYLIRLWEQSKSHDGNGSIVCEKYNCSFQVLSHGDDYNDADVILKTGCNKKRTPFSLKELAMVKVTQQIATYDVETLLWIYFRFLVDISFHGGEEWLRIVWNVRRIFMHQIHRRENETVYENIPSMYLLHVDDANQFSQNPIPYCEKCYEMEFSNENLHSDSWEKHCDVCSLFKNIRFSTSLLNTNGHFADCCNRK